MVAPCPADNTATEEQTDFWTGEWDAHKIGWLVSGAAAGLTCLLALITITLHSLHYTRPMEQRQIIRILLFPAVFAVVSFLSYRFFRSYTYYELAEVAYEAFAIAAFLMLLLQYVGDNVEAQREVFARKEKYIIVRPALSIAGIVLETQNLLCTSSYSYRYGEVYLVAIDFASISVALYALIVLYGLLREDLKGKQPLAKFMTIKLAIFFTFYQSFVFGLLQDHDVIKATTYWTATNVSDGLSALCVSVEMVIVAAFQMWAFPWSEYYLENQPKPQPLGKMSEKGRTNIFRSLVHALNFSDFFIELWHSLRFGFDRLRGKEYTRSDVSKGKFDIAAAFGAVGQTYATPAAGLQARRAGAKPLQSDPATTSLRSGSPFEMQDRDADPLRHYPAGMGSGGTAPPQQQQWAGFHAAGMDDYSQSDMRPPPSMAARERTRRPSYDPVPVGDFARPRFDGQKSSSDLPPVHEPFPGIAPPPRNASGSTNASAQRLPLPDDDALRRTASPSLVVHIPTAGADGRLTPTSPMRRSPSPSGGGPRESTGRYPSFVFESFKNDASATQSGDNSQAGSSAHSSLRPGQALSTGFGFPGQQEPHPPRQPSPFDERTWNMPYRVQGFPRESFIETQSSTPPLNTPPINIQPRNNPHENAARAALPQTQYFAPQPSFIPSRQQTQHRPQESHTQQSSGWQSSLSQPDWSQQPSSVQRNPSEPYHQQQQQPRSTQLSSVFDAGRTATSIPSSQSAFVSPSPPDVSASARQSSGVAQWATRDSLFAPQFNSAGGVVGEDDAGSMRTSSRPGSWEPQAF